MADDNESEQATPESKPSSPASPASVAAEPAEAADSAPAATSTAEASSAAAPSADAAEDDVALDAQGRERARFLLQFPKDPELSRLAAAFEAGNYALVRTGAVELAERTENRAVREAALELRRRIDPDPLVKYLLALVLCLLLFLAYFAYHH